MDKEILLALYRDNDSQSKRLIKYFVDTYGIKHCSGEQYSKIITYLNIFYNKQHSDDELKNIITDGDGDGGFSDAFNFHKNSFDIFDIKESPNLKLREIQQIKNRIKDLVFPSVITGFNYGSSDICRIKEHLKKVHSGDKKTLRCNIYIIRESFADFNNSIKDEIKEIEKNPATSVFFLDKDKFILLLLKQKICKNWRFINSDFERLHEGLKRKKLNYLILNTRASSLLNLFADNIKRDINLFDKNIRTPKKIKNLSNGIVSTIENNTKNFFLFHNGITITVSKIKQDAGGITIYEPQVVNGGHTLKNLLDKYGKDLSNTKIQEAHIICKIIEADSDTIDLICEASNTQRPVKVQDLRTSDIFQKKLALFIQSKSNNVFSYKTKNIKVDNIAIGYVEFFQWIYAIRYNNPAGAKNARQKIFEKGDRNIYEELKLYIHHNLSKLILLCQISHFVKENIKKESEKSKNGFLKIINIYLITSLFLLKSLKFSDFEKIYTILKKYADEEIKKDPSKNNSKIFNQSDKAWIYLKLKLKLK